jgi:hypothetical protein
VTDAHRGNRRLWDERSDAFRALWNADTDEGGETTSEGDAAAAAEPRALLPDTLGFWARLDPR